MTDGPNGVTRSYSTRLARLTKLIISPERFLHFFSRPGLVHQTGKSHKSALTVRTRADQLGTLTKPQVRQGVNAREVQGPEVKDVKRVTIPPKRWVPIDVYFAIVDRITDVELPPYTKPLRPADDNDCYALYPPEEWNAAGYGLKGGW